MDGCAGRRAIAAVGAAVLVMCTVPASAVAACAGGDKEAEMLNLDEARAAFGCVVDERRRDAGRGRWRDDDRLALAARRHALDMVERDYFAHESPGGRDVMDRIRRTGWAARRTRWRAGETLAWGTGSASTPRSLVAAWMRSPGHRRILLDDGYDAAGIGVARGAPARGGQNAFTVVLVAAGGS
jgi:uncharacterized protein YkwD